MIKRLKDQYFAELSELFNKMCVKLQHVDSIIPPQISSEQYDRMKSFKTMLERILQMLQIGKSSVQPAMRDKVPRYEKQIISILNSQRKPVQPQIQQQFQPPPGRRGRELTMVAEAEAPDGRVGQDRAAVRVVRARVTGEGGNRASKARVMGS
uniref:Mediator of RNA polymerase II transcription subunit 15a n=1 Tax=Triticum urartu TaxID=4572 RepID=A0A8R7RBT3_TRIUA